MPPDFLSEVVDAARPAALADPADNARIPRVYELVCGGWVARHQVPDQLSFGIAHSGSLPNYGAAEWEFGPEARESLKAQDIEFCECRASVYQNLYAKFVAQQILKELNITITT